MTFTCFIRKVPASLRLLSYWEKGLLFHQSVLEPVHLLAPPTLPRSAGRSGHRWDPGCGHHRPAAQGEEGHSTERVPARRASPSGSLTVLGATPLPPTPAPPVALPWDHTFLGAELDFPLTTQMSGQQPPPDPIPASATDGAFIRWLGKKFSSSPSSK